MHSALDYVIGHHSEKDITDQTETYLSHLLEASDALPNYRSATK